MKILLTGFEPFGGSELNPSAMVVEALASDPPADVDLVTVVLEVVGEEAGDRVVELVATERPDAVVMLGEATGRAGVTIEQVAINLRDYGMNDNAGNRVSNQPVVDAAPDAYFTTLPVEELVQAVRAIGVPAARSLSAGAFLCNEISYRVLHAEAIAKRRTPAGFVHLPRVP
ncbi:MAG: pyroglutamyl-peptidase I, partial [Phycisphaeraceae bacterium]|nr:pyroglutamyl-peptidase I [Phycisphaeraceae bacterium]